MKPVSQALLCVVLCMFAVLPSLAGASGYSTTPLGEYRHYPTAVAAAGSVVAGYDGIDYAPAVYTPTAGWVDLPSASGLNTSLYYGGTTTGISQNGQVITGYTYGTSSGAYVQYAVYWTSGLEHIIPPPPDDTAAADMTATAVSGDGSAILVEDTESLTVTAYVYNVATKAFTALGFLGQSVRQTHVTGLSYNGSVVVGFSNLDNGNSDCFTWSAATGMQDIGIPDGHPGTFYVEPACVSGGGTRVFGSYTDGSGWMGFYWSKTGGWQFLGFSPSVVHDRRAAGRRDHEHVFPGDLEREKG